MVIGMVKDKDIDKVLSLLPTSATYYFCNADMPRAMPAQELAAKAKLFDLYGNIYSSVNLALEAAKLQATPHDLIFVGGSTFVVAEIC
jgi:dihydrofolate synthase/folylpolyglutamate synthase